MSSPCKTLGCARAAYAGRRECNPCRMAREKQRDPEAHAYRKLKSNAKGRGIFFDLTLDQFRAFCYETQILCGRGRGRASQSFHVDRMDDALGYTAGNLQKLTNRDNLAKEMARRKSVAWVSHFDYTGEPRPGGVLRVLPLTGSPAAPVEAPPF